MAFTRREYAGAAPQTTLASPIGASDTTIPLISGTGYPTGATGPFFIVLDIGTASEEKVLCLSRTGASITVASAGDRGADGTSATTHATGATVNHCFTAQDADEANAHVTDTARDDHTQYHTSARHAAVSHLIGTHLPSPGTPPSIGVANTEGSSTAAARGDHTHALSSAVVGSGIGLFGTVLYARVDNVSVTVNGSGLIEVVPSVGTVTDGSITSSKLAAGAVTTVGILDANVTTPKIADANVTTAKIADANVTGAKLAANTVTSDKLSPSNSVPHTSAVRFNASATSNGSGTAYASFPPSAGGPIQIAGFVKHRADTSIFVKLGGDGYCVTGAGHRFTLACYDGATQWEVCRWWDSGLNVHAHHGGERELTGLAAGTYTLTAYLKTDSGSGTAWQVDTNTTWFMEATEAFS